LGFGGKGGAAAGLLAIRMVPNFNKPAQSEFHGVVFWDCPVCVTGASVPRE
jgi:hypothetical protein